MSVENSKPHARCSAMICYTWISVAIATTTTRFSRRHRYTFLFFIPNTSNCGNLNRFNSSRGSASYGRFASCGSFLYFLPRKVSKKRNTSWFLKLQSISIEQLFWGFLRKQSISRKAIVFTREPLQIIYFFFICNLLFLQAFKNKKKQKKKSWFETVTNSPTIACSFHRFQRP